MYTLIFLLVGDLPWNRLNACDLLDAYGQIQQLKQTSRAKLVDGLPPVFKKILENIDTTVQGGNPNYGMIRAEL